MANSRKLPRALDARGSSARLRAFLQSQLSPQAALTLGLSGGMDSCVLLHLLCQLRETLDFQLCAVHVNHQISPHAIAWENFCESLCLQWRLPFTAVRVEVPRDTGLGLEAAARAVRYQALRQHCRGSLVLAHHRDDQAETVLLQLLRGTGVAGMAAMPSIAEMAGVAVLRPLLEISRDELQQYAMQHGLRWVEDESNNDARFDRNFLRHAVFPVLAQRFPAYATTLTRSALNFAESSEMLDQLAAQDAAPACAAGRLEMAVLKTLTPLRAANMLRWWICRETGQTVSRSRLHDILRQLTEARADAQVTCVVGGVALRRYRQWLCVDRGVDVAPYRVAWHGGDAVQLPDGSKLQCRCSAGDSSIQQALAALQISNRMGKPAQARLEIQLEAHRPTRSLKNLWQETGIPPWERARVPLIWRDTQLLAVPGLGVAFQFGADCPGITFEWVRADGVNLRD